MQQKSLCPVVVCPYSYIYIYIYIHIYIYIYTYIHTYIHTYIQTYIHTYIHTYIYTYLCSSKVRGLSADPRPGFGERPRLLYYIILYYTILYYTIAYYSILYLIADEAVEGGSGRPEAPRFECSAAPTCLFSSLCLTYYYHYYYHYYHRYYCLIIIIIIIIIIIGLMLRRPNCQRALQELRGAFRLRRRGCKPPCHSPPPTLVTTFLRCKGRYHGFPEYGTPPPPNAQWIDAFCFL